MPRINLPVAQVEIGQFEDQKALIVERFDRRRAVGGKYWLRIPQEDFCQASGLPPTRKYESDGGPGIRSILEILRGSELAAVDRANFFRTQLLFWAMAATNGHAKYFSLRLLAFGRYQLTPLCDILSTYPVQGRKVHQFDPRNCRHAMAVESRNRHYVLADIHRWHWVTMAASLGLAEGLEPIIAELIERTPPAFDAVAEYLPEGFPIALFDSVKAGTMATAKRLAREPDRRSTT